MSKVSAIFEKHLAAAQALYQEQIAREIAELEAQLAALDAKQERHNAECARTSGAVTNPANEIGGIRSRSPKQKQQMFDRWTRQAREATDLHHQRARILVLIASKHGFIQRQAAAAATDEILRLVLRPGDVVWVWGQTRGRVARVNAKSVTVQTGITERVPWDAIGLENWQQLAEKRLE